MNNINYNSENNFENMIYDLINMNKNTNLEINNIKNEIKKKNDIINNLNLNNNRLKQDLLDKDNIIQKKENEVIALSKDNILYKKKYEEFNHNINNNSNNNIDSIIELRKEMKNLYNENNTLRNQLNDIKLNMIGGNKGQNHSGTKKYFLEKNKNDN